MTEIGGGMNFKCIEYLLAIVHTFPCRLYGRRKYKHGIKADFPGCAAIHPKALCE